MSTPSTGSARRPRTPRARTRDASRTGVRPRESDPWAPEALGFVLVGTVVGAHGVRGEAKVRADTDFGRQRLGVVASAAQRYLLLPGRRYPRPVGVAAGRPATQEDVWILRFEGMGNREEVEKRRGARIYVKEVDRPRMSREEFLVGDLVGMGVALAEEPGQVFGRVVGVITRQELCAASGAGAAAAAVAADLLEIAIFGEFDAGGNEQTTLVPFVKQIVPTVNRKDDVILLTPPEGLLDIAKVNNKYKAPPPRGLLCAAVEIV